MRTFFIARQLSSEEERNITPVRKNKNTFCGFIPYGSDKTVSTDSQLSEQGQEGQIISYLSLQIILNR